MRTICFLITAFSIAISSCKQSDRTTLNLAEMPGDSHVTDDTAFDSAYSLARVHRNEDSFDHEFELTTDKGKKIKTRLMIGNFFGRGKYLIIKRESPVHSGIDGPVHFIDIYCYSKWNDTFNGVIRNAEDLENYVGDTIQDINGDGRKDYCKLSHHVEWYKKQVYNGESGHQ